MHGYLFVSPTDLSILVNIVKKKRAVQASQSHKILRKVFLHYKITMTQL